MDHGGLNRRAGMAEETSELRNTGLQELVVHGTRFFFSLGSPTHAVFRPLLPPVDCMSYYGNLPLIPAQVSVEVAGLVAATWQGGIGGSKKQFLNRGDIERAPSVLLRVLLQDRYGSPSARNYYSYCMR